MEIVKLAVGISAPPDVDCISIDPLPDGRVNLTGSLLQGEESLAILKTDTFESVEDAEAAGIAWAAEHGVATLFVSVSAS